MPDSKEELLNRLQRELDAMRERAEMAKHLATSSPTRDGFLLEHAANIQRAAVSLEAIIGDIQNAWKESETNKDETLARPA